VARLRPPSFWRSAQLLAVRAIRLRSIAPARRWVEQTLKKLTPDEKIGPAHRAFVRVRIFSARSDTFEP